MAEEKYMIKKYENLYPKGFKKILDLNLIDFDIWFRFCCKVLNKE